ncbi:MAG: hypothetical protein ABWY52_02790 [Candidatus Limnocylindrales bacterium]
MSRRTTMWSFLVGMAFLLTACGGSAATSPPATDAGGGGTAATDAPQPTDAAAATDAGSGGGGGTSGSFDGKVCDLLTPSEVEGVMGASGVTTTETPYLQNAGYCLYSSADGSAAVAISFLDGAVGSAAWDAYSAILGDDVVQIDGIGDGAIFIKSAASLYLWKNGRMVGITAGLSADDEAQRIDWSKQLADFIDDRL